MVRGWITTSIMTALLLSFAIPAASAQESFLEQFRTVTRSDRRAQTFAPIFVATKQEADSLALPQGNFVNISDSHNDEQSRLHSAGYSADLICAEDLCSEAPSSNSTNCEIPLVRFRNACFQGAQASYGTLNDDAATGIAVRTLETNATFAIPLGSMENVISFTPYIRADALEAAAIFDVPDSLYDTGVKMFWKRPINDRLGSMVLVTPSIRSDFETNEGAFRLFGMALLTWQWIPKTLSVSGGVVYTGREDFPVLPAMGLLWTPSPEWRVDVQFPSPRISRRIRKNGGDSETWAYLSGVFGGNTWAVTRTGGAEDILTISDLRLVTGIEYLQRENRGFFAEVGYVFNRSIEYTNVPFQADLDSAVMLRFGVSF